MKARKATATLLLCIFSFYELALPFAFPQEKVVIAIVDFQNTSADDTLDYLEKTIPESISTTLAKGGRLEIVERSRLESALKEMEMHEIGIVDEQTAAELGRAVGASAILVGSYVSIGSVLRINARLIDVQTSKVIKAESVQGRVGVEIFDLMDQMAISMEGQLVGGQVPEEVIVPEPEPEPVQPQPPVAQQPRVVPRKRKTGWILPVVILGGAAAIYYFTLAQEDEPAKVTINVDIEP
ncbi:MAG: hypothetical protein JSW54_01855 [Fidelibacterota bacterium]|nr:MAG: hypothetical protein JSW54_01855 [Candidatus Neomarinimicrobiota bacterium]